MTISQGRSNSYIYIDHLYTPKHIRLYSWENWDKIWGTLCFLEVGQSCQSQEEWASTERAADAGGLPWPLRVLASQGPLHVSITRRRFHWLRTKLEQQVFRAGVLKFQLWFFYEIVQVIKMSTLFSCIRTGFISNDTAPSCHSLI